MVSMRTRSSSQPVLTRTTDSLASAGAGHLRSGALDSVRDLRLRALGAGEASDGVGPPRRWPSDSAVSGRWALPLWGVGYFQFGRWGAPGPGHGPPFLPPLPSFPSLLPPAGGAGEILGALGPGRASGDPCGAIGLAPARWAAVGMGGTAPPGVPPGPRALRRREGREGGDRRAAGRGRIK